LSNAIKNVIIEKIEKVKSEKQMCR